MPTDRRLRPPIRPLDHAAVDAVESVDVGRSVPADAIFPQSVGSGGPTPSGVILWTRLRPDAVDGETPLFVEVGPESTETFEHRWRIDPSKLGSVHDYTVRVDLHGLLDPDSHYRYRFVYDGVASATGRCRTLPRPTASPDSLRLGVLSCQDYQNGYFGALAHVADEDLDFLLHLGDFIYNSAAGQFKGLGSESYPDRGVDLPSGHERAWSLADFRELYRTYLSDEHLKRARERHTVLRVWDDHAVANNRHWDYSTDAPRAPDHPRGTDPEFMRELTGAGIQSFWEYTPARVEYDPSAAHLHDRFHLWRQLQFGDLATILLTDERLFRSSPPCGGRLVTGWPPLCSEASSPNRTMLGKTQREWFTGHVADSSATWTIWGNEVLSLPLRVGAGPIDLYPKVDSWDGFPVERRIIRDAMARNGETNFVTLTGDMHTALAGYQHRRPMQSDSSTERVGVEFMTPAVTSVNVAEAVGVEERPLSALTEPAFSKAMRAMNPQYSFINSHRWGYSVVEFTREECTYTVYEVDKKTDSADARKAKLREFSVPAGRVELRDET